MINFSQCRFFILVRVYTLEARHSIKQGKSESRAEQAHTKKMVCLVIAPTAKVHYVYIYTPGESCEAACGRASTFNKFLFYVLIVVAAVDIVIVVWRCYFGGVSQAFTHKNVFIIIFLQDKPLCVSGRIAKCAVPPARSGFPWHGKNVRAAARLSKRRA